eukprot:4399452-Karenia_brevis.AAC.1
MAAELEPLSGVGMPTVHEQFWVQMKMFLERIFEEKAKVPSSRDQSQERKQVVLDEKHFRRMDKFSGDVA